MLKPLLSWIFGPHIFELVAFFLAAAGLALALSTSKANIQASHWFFGASFVMLLGRVIHWLVTTSDIAYPKPVVAALLFALIGGGWMVVYQWVEKQIKDLSPPTAAVPSKPPVEVNPPKTVRDVFDSDFPYLPKANMEGGLSIGHKKEKSQVPIARKIYQDFAGGNKFVGFYVPLINRQGGSFDACLKLPEWVQVTFSDFEKYHEVSGGPMDQMTSEKDLRFSGRVMLYYEDFLSITQKAQIIEAFKRKNCDVQLRGPEYLNDAIIAWHREHDKKN